MKEITKNISKSQRIQEGQLLVRTIIEMLGYPKEHVQKTIVDYVNSLKQNKKLEIIKEYFSEPEKDKDKNLFFVYTELEIWFKDPEALIEFCFDSLPSSIEILEPEEFRFKSNKFSGLLNDLQAKLHKLDASLKKYITDQKAGAEKFRIIVDNFMIYCIKTGNMTAKEISEITGIEEERTKRWLDEMVEKKIINKKDNLYSID